jgi:hypothetical protein
MNEKRVSLASLFVSAIACVLAAAAVWHRSTVPAAATDLDPTADRLESLARQLADLRAELARNAVESREGAGQRAPLATAPEQRTSISPEMLQRLQALEESVSALQKQAKERRVVGAAPRGAPVDAAEAQRIATDPTAAAEQKLAALKTLRGQQVDGRDARSHDVVVSMLDLADRSADEGTRVDVYRNLHGTPDPALRDAMLRALASDPSTKVREKVAEDIDTFLADPAVLNALRQVANGDSDDAVRGAALKTLSKKH